MKLRDAIDLSPGAETLVFGLGKAMYAIDLGEANRNLFHDSVRLFVAGARKSHPVGVKPKDSLDGSQPADLIHFAVGCTKFHIFLSRQNLQALMTALRPFIDHAVRIRGRAPGGKKTHMSKGARWRKTVADWANENGWRIDPKGSIPDDAIAAYKDRNNPQHRAPSDVTVRHVEPRAPRRGAG